jgi:hypothetical protein
MPVCTPGMHSDGPHQAQEQMILGRPRRHWFQHWDGNGVPTMFLHLHCENQGNESERHSVFQTSIYNKPIEHTQNTLHKGSIGPHQCVKRNGLMQWQDSRGTRKVQRDVHKDSQGKISNGKGKRAMKQPPNPPQCPPS